MIKSNDGAANNAGIRLLWADNWRNGDVVATCSPAPSYLVLNRTDYYMIQYGAESKNDVDVWTGAPIIDTVEKFKHVLNENIV